MEIYPWIVIGHVFFVVVAFAAHGVSAFSSFGIKRSSDRAELRTLLDLSETSPVAAGIGLLIVVVLGIWAAIIGGHFSRAWPWVAIGVLVVVTVAMTPLAANPMRAMRAALGMGKEKSGAPPTPGTDAELAAAQAKLRPEATTAVGVLELLILVWLMEAKPF